MLRGRETSDACARRVLSPGLETAPRFYQIVIQRSRLVQISRGGFHRESRGIVSGSELSWMHDREHRSRCEVHL